MNHYPFAPGVIECQRQIDALAKRQQRRQQLRTLRQVAKTAYIILASLSLGYVLICVLAKVFA